MGSCCPGPFPVAMVAGDFVSQLSQGKVFALSPQRALPGACPVLDARQLMSVFGQASYGRRSWGPVASCTECRQQ